MRHFFLDLSKKFHQTLPKFPSVTEDYEELEALDCVYKNTLSHSAAQGKLARGKQTLQKFRPVYSSWDITVQGVLLSAGSRDGAG